MGESVEDVKVVKIVEAVEAVALRPVGGWRSGQRISDFELRNREPARRVGVRRTNVDVKVSSQ